VARVLRAPDALVRAREQDVRVFRRLRERVYAVAPQLVGLAPGAPAVFGLEEAARLLVTVRGGVDNAGVARVYDDVVDEQAGAVEGFDARPRGAAVRGGVYLSVDGSEVETPRVARVDGERAHVAAERACYLPV